MYHIKEWLRRLAHVRYSVGVNIVNNYDARLPPIFLSAERHYSTQAGLVRNFRININVRFIGLL